ncbi:N-formylglutamate amidohydrolase [Tsuneonella dongtanensis]|uniref:N-formylglutamate amidohydrolase n=1 Tax=Tsuneonella dongtanensis TaxID=692370 RepID=A0A1B2ACK0_9SPHN|nr:N-formylglutamate amidohydrolase [Tsuneonella dongtanensis]ANY19892.1 N-formylglutamate amidohydrolase [Tsuneonella dongtanensis]
MITSAVMDGGTAIGGIEGEGGGEIPGSAVPAFTLRRPAGAPIPVLIAAPHGGKTYPPQLIERMRDAEFAALRLEDRHVDRLADAVASATGAALLVANAPRAMLDLNRATDDMDWSMVAEGAPNGVRHSAANRRARSGLGLVPRRLTGLGEIWKNRLDREELEARIAGVHAPYHAALAGALEDLRDRWGAVLLIDLHSMPPLATRPGEQRPGEFVIGDRFGASCQHRLVRSAFAFFERHDRVALHNRPYAGGYVLDRHALPARGIHALQIEVCRTSYLDARFAEPSGRFAGVARTLAGLVRALASEVADMGGARLPLAAE